MITFEKVTYICLYYNQEELNRMLLDSFRNILGATPSNLILIDNSGKRYKSSAEAYNRTIQDNYDKIQDIIVFIHPDMAFDDLRFEHRIVKELSEDGDQILGFAGKVDKRVYTNLKHRTTKENVAIPFEDKLLCETLDECCFAMTKELYLKIKFDEYTCDNFHLYAADVCYDAKRKYNVKSYILPELMYHKERGGGGLTDDKHFIRAMYRMTLKYKNDFDKINTTCYECPTHGLWRKIHLSCSWFHNVRYDTKKFLLEKIASCNRQNKRTIPFRPATNNHISLCHSDLAMGGGIPRLSIIIISFNTKEVTDQCIASINSSIWRDKIEIIVVDNNSADGSVEMLREKYPEVKVIANDDNKLFAKANNQAAKIAQGEYLLLLNSDTIVYDDNLQKMIDFFGTLPDDVICIGPKILNPDKTIQSYGAPKYGYAEHFICSMGMHKRLKFLQKIWKTLPSSPNITHQVGWVSGACMMIPKDKYERVGGLNEALEFYGEEPEFGFRTSKLGFKTIYYHEAEIIHLGGYSTKKENSKKHTERSLEDDLRRYDCLVDQTNGVKEAITITQITILVNRIKLLLSRSRCNREIFNHKIEHEKKVVAHLKSRLKNRLK